MSSLYTVAGSIVTWTADRWQYVGGSLMPLKKVKIHVEEIMQVCIIAVCLPLVSCCQQVDRLVAAETVPKLQPILCRLC